MNSSHIWIIVLAYLIGSIPFAVVISKIMGLKDPRTYGSKNPGATNILRSGNKVAALFTFLGDFLKGWFAVWLAIYWGYSAMVIAIVACAVFIGHLFSIFLKFRGGKGVATAAGVCFGLSSVLGVLVVLTWLVIAVIFRYSSLAALVTAILAPIYAWYLSLIPVFVYAILIIAILLILRHFGNIRNLLKGKETKIGAKKRQ